MREERIEPAGVPARLYDPGMGRGLLLFGHGGGRSKDSSRFVGLCRRYAAETGLTVVCIDAVDHGERGSSGAGGAIPPQWHAEAMAQMVTDWQTTAAELSSLGDAVAYVGFSMGAIFGAPTVATMPSIRAAVFGVGGIPTRLGIAEEPLRSLLLAAASGLGSAEVLMLNMTRDEIFATADTHAFFDAIPGAGKRLMFWDGAHDDWPPEAIDHSIAFIGEHTTH